METEKLYKVRVRISHKNGTNLGVKSEMVRAADSHAASLAAIARIESRGFQYRSIASAPVVR